MADSEMPTTARGGLAGQRAFRAKEPENSTSARHALMIAPFLRLYISSLHAAVSTLQFRSFETCLNFFVLPNTPMSIRILLVEDEPSIAEIVEFALASEGFQVAWRHLAGEAEAELAATSYDLVVLDIGLPDGSGLELLKRIRRTSEVPVAILSARNAELDRVLGLELGADDYVTKPFSPRELAARVKAILKRTVRPGVAPQEVVASEPTEDVWFEVDEDRASVRFRGRPLELTRYEYLIIKALLAQPERVFSRAQLMDRAWPDPAASFERSVDTHIKSLRAKLRDVDPRVDPIRTHRGLGYSMRIGDRP